MLASRNRRRATRRNPRRAARRGQAKHRTARRGQAKRRTSRRGQAKRRNPRPGVRRIHAGKIKRKRARKGRGAMRPRRNPWKLSSKTRRGSRRVRRNPGIGKMFKKVPVIGGTLAAAFGSMPAGLLAGVAMEIPLRLSPIVSSQTWIPAVLKENEFAYFTLLSALSGAVVAGGLKMAGISKIPFLGSIANLPGLMTAAGAGAGYVKMRSRQLANEAGIATPEQQVGGDEPVAGMGALVSSSTGGYGLLSADMGMGPGFSVSPGGFSGAMGAVLVGS